MLNDLLLLTKIREGDVKAFETLFKSYHTPLCYYAAGITGSMDVAEEIVQDIFYYFWKEKQKLPLLHSIKSYLYKAVRNQALQYCEHLSVRNKYKDAVLSEANEASLSGPEEKMELEELENLIDRTLKKMPERRRKIFYMHRFQKIKYAGIAASMSISVKTVEAEITKTLQALRKEIEDYIKQ